MMEPQGYCADAFAAVREAFQENFATGEELGASACVVHDGEVVVDLWGGASAPGGEPWRLLLGRVDRRGRSRYPYLDRLCDEQNGRKYAGRSALGADYRGDLCLAETVTLLP